MGPVILEDYDGGEEPRKAGGRVPAVSHEDMPQLQQSALAQKEEGEDLGIFSLKARAIIQGTISQG